MLGSTGGRADPAAEARPSDRIVATYSGGRVTAERYASWLRFRGARAEGVPRSRQVEDLVFVTVLAQEARDAGIAREDATLMELGMLADRRLADALRGHRASKVVVTERQVDEALAGTPDAFQKPARVRLRTLFKRFPSDGDSSALAALRRELEALRARVREGADFARLARTQSDSQARFRDGLLGNVAPGQLPAEIERIAFALEPGEVSQIVEGPTGYSLFYCEERLPPVVRPRAEVRELVADSLRRFETKQDWQRYRESLVSRAAVRFEPEGGGDGEIVARWDEGTVSRSELATWRRMLAAPPLEDPSEEVVHAVAEQLLLARLAAAEARRLGLDRDPALIERLEWEETVLLATKRLAALVAAQVTPPSEADVQSYFEAHRERFVWRQHFDLSVILRLATQESLPQEYAEALALQERLERGEIEFAAAARAHSEHPSGPDGGRLGWVARPRMAALGRNVFNTVLELQPGETSRVVQQDLGLWIVHLHDKEPQRPLTWAEAREAAEATLGDEMTQSARDAIETRIRADLGIELLS